VHSREVDGRWSELAMAPFSGQYGAEATLSPDGQCVVLCTGAPAGGGPPANNWQIWFVYRNGEGWDAPVNAGFPPNSPEQSAAYPSLAASGNLYYFSGDIPGGLGGGDIWVSALTDGKYLDPVNIGTSVNSEHWELDPYISPDERLIVFASNRPGGLGGFDLYVSYRGDDGSWLAPRNPGPAVNSSADEFHPFVSLDGQYLFFCSKRSSHANYSTAALTYEEKMKALDSAGNGAEDIYWVSVGALD
jgi:Tol biopolymer transport system component